MPKAPNTTTNYENTNALANAVQFSIRHLLLLTLAVSIGIAIACYQPRTKWEKMSVKDSLDRLLAAISEKHPEVKIDNIQGMDSDEIAEIRKALPEAPLQLFELLRYYDFNSSNIFVPIDLYKPRDFRHQIQQTSDFYNNPDLEFQEWAPTKSSLRCCKHDELWREKWIPIGQFNGNPYFIDMDPGEDGVPGQIVSENEGFLWVEAYSIAHWLDRLADNVEQGGTNLHGYAVFCGDEVPPPR